MNSPNKRSRGYAAKVVRFEYSIRDMQSSFRKAGRTENESHFDNRRVRSHKFNLC